MKIAGIDMHLWPCSRGALAVRTRAKGHDNAKIENETNTFRGGSLVSQVEKEIDPRTRRA